MPRPNAVQMWLHPSLARLGADSLPLSAMRIVQRWVAKLTDIYSKHLMTQLDDLYKFHTTHSLKCLIITNVRMPCMIGLIGF